MRQKSKNWLVDYALTFVLWNGVLGALGGMAYGLHYLIKVDGAVTIAILFVTLGVPAFIVAVLNLKGDASL